jgi:hypothetical protein
MKRVTNLFAMLLLVFATASPAAAKPITYFDRDFEELSDPFYDLCPFGVA